MLKIAGWLLTLAVAAVALLSLDPARLSLSTTAPLTQAIALRSVLAAGFAALGTLLLLGVLVGLLLRRRSARRTVLAVILLGVALGHAGALYVRGIDTSGDLAAREDAVLTVLALNTYGGATASQDVTDVAAEVEADVLMLPETSAANAEIIAHELAATTGVDYQWFVRSSGSWDARSTALLVAEHLGEYIETTAPDTVLGAVRAEPAGGDGPVLAAVHPVAPHNAIGSLADWKSDLAAVTALCREVPGVVVGGDFNATLDHAPMRDIGDCVDAAVEGGVGGVATWPTWAPALVGAPIDHVLLDGDAFEVRSTAVRDVGGSDHRAVITRIAPRD